MTKLHFFYCSQCGGILSIDNSCPICKTIEQKKPLDSLEPLLPNPVGTSIDDSQLEMQKGRERLKREIVFIDSSDTSLEIKQQRIPRFLRIEDGEPIIWFPCPTCNDIFREVTVITWGSDPKKELFGDCGHLFQEELPADVVAKISKEIDN